MEHMDGNPFVCFINFGKVTLLILWKPNCFELCLGIEVISTSQPHPTPGHLFELQGLGLNIMNYDFVFKYTWKAYEIPWSMKTSNDMIINVCE